ncbi:MAG: hypothetical protein QM691_07320 [Opitutaceae bacterium]
MTKTTTVLIAAGALAAMSSFFSCPSAPTPQQRLAWEQPPYPPPLPGDDDKTQKSTVTVGEPMLAWEQPPCPQPLPGDDRTQKASARAATTVA